MRPNSLIAAMEGSTGCGGDRQKMEGESPLRLRSSKAHIAPELCAVGREAAREALTGHRRQPRSQVCQHVICLAVESAGGCIRADLLDLTNAFSKKVENHAHPVALFTYYNSVRIHKTLRTTPAMATKMTERLWKIGDIVGVLQAWEAAN